MKWLKDETTSDSMAGRLRQQNRWMDGSNWRARRKRRPFRKLDARIIYLSLLYAPESGNGGHQGTSEGWLAPSKSDLPLDRLIKATHRLLEPQWSWELNVLRLKQAADAWMCHAWLQYMQLLSWLIGRASQQMDWLDMFAVAGFTLTQSQLALPRARPVIAPTVRPTNRLAKWNRSLPR